MGFVDSPTEQTTAVTDLILAVLALGCAGSLWRGRAADAWKATLWSWAFGLLGLASLLGALAHGLTLPPPANRLVWQPLYLALGLVIALFVTGATYDGWGHPVARRVWPGMIVVALTFFTITQVFSGTFLVFVIYEAVAMLLALGIYTWLTFRRRLRGAGLMTVGVLITIIAAAIQASQAVSFTLIWPFDHNGVYHLVQMVGVLALVAGLKAGLRPQPTPPA